MTSQLLKIPDGSTITIRSGIVRGAGPRGPQGDVGGPGPDGPEGPVGPPGSINDFYTELTDDAAVSTDSLNWTAIPFANPTINELLVVPVDPSGFAFGSAGRIGLFLNMRFDERTGGGSSGARAIRLVDDLGNIIGQPVEVGASSNSPTIVPFSTVFEADPVRTYHFEAQSEDTTTIDVTTRRCALVQLGSGPAGAGLNFLSPVGHSGAAGITAYPHGLSIMGIEGVAGWPATYGMVITVVSSDGQVGYQEFIQTPHAQLYYESSRQRWIRRWDTDNALWTGWSITSEVMPPVTVYASGSGSLAAPQGVNWVESLSGAALAKVDFIAPPTGKAKVFYSLNMRNADGASSAGVGNGGYAVAGVRIKYGNAVVRDPSNNVPGNVEEGVLNPTAWYLTLSDEFIVDTLIPGRTYTAVFVHRSTVAGNNCGFSNRRIVVTPIP